MAMFNSYVSLPGRVHQKKFSWKSASCREEWGDTCGLQIRNGGSEIVGYQYLDEKPWPSLALGKL